MNKIHNKQLENRHPIKSKHIFNGYAMLTTVIIILAIVGTVSITLLIISTSFVNSARINSDAIRARQAADACAEVALNGLRTDYNLTAGSTVYFNKSSCKVIAITGSGGVNRVLQVEGYSGNSVSRIAIDIASLNPISVTKWDYVSAF